MAPEVPTSHPYVDVLISLSLVINLFEVVWVQRLKQVVEVDDEENPVPAKSLGSRKLFQVLKPYFWPKGAVNRLRVFATWFCLIGSKVCNIFIPL